jgi:hypothetical protein
MAKRHLVLIPQLQSFLSGYQQSTGIEELPLVDGAVCRLKNLKCDVIELYASDNRIGAAVPHSGELQFFGEGAMEFSVFKSHKNDRYFNEVTKYDGLEAVTMLDDDRDLRPDWRLDSKEGEVNKATQLSGRVAVKFSAALSNRSQDWFSKPDMFVQVFKNARYLGRTETQFNTFLPQFYTFVVIDYKFGDAITLDFVDDDSFELLGFTLKERYETMGSLSITHLPRTGFRAVNEHIGLYLDVRKTTLPEGVSTEPKIILRESHPFESDMAYENPEMTDYLLASYDAQMQTVWGELAGSIAMTELMMMPIGHATLMQRLVLMFIGHEMSHGILTQTNDKDSYLNENGE